MKNYKHFIIIRFNIRANFTCNLKDSSSNPMNRILDETYLDERFFLFETYTLSSLKNQTCQHFETIVLFHKNTPTRFKDKVLKLQREYPFQTLFLADEEKFSFSQYICDKYGKKSDYYITSRLDNDDMVADTYVEQIQKYIDNQHNLETCFLSFPRGQKLDLFNGKRYDFLYKQNHFLSMWGPQSTNVFQYDHSSIDNSGVDIVVLESEEAMWTEIVHSTNVANKIQPYVKYQHIVFQLGRVDIYKKLTTTNVAIYGVGAVGKAVYEKIKGQCGVCCFIDEYANIKEYSGVAVLKIGELFQIQEKFCVLIAVSYDQQIIANKLTEQLGNNVDIFDIYDICDY